MLLTTTKGDPATLIEIEGEVNLFNAPRLREEIETLHTSGTMHFILDFQNVSYVDSTGIGSLIASQQTLNKGGGSLALVRLPEPVVVLFTTTKILNYFRVFDTEEEARSALPS